MALNGRLGKKQSSDKHKGESKVSCSIQLNQLQGNVTTDSPTWTSKIDVPFIQYNDKYFVRRNNLNCKR